ncbi:MAG TPA: amidophosphoribosyltransferase, partial [Candidatus Omnitrophica bacterium]|nr:amidophosphoribosyltransferase [Candidatus Omnitrophota bacterium]
MNSYSLQPHFCKLYENCGLFAVYNHPQASYLTYLGLYALQHRGEESAGIVSYNGREFFIHKELGHVADVFNEDILNKLKGESAIGHVRYSTYGSTNIENAQPLLVKCAQGAIAIAHNGNLVNALQLRKELESQGAIFQTTTDSEIILHLIAHSSHDNLLDSLIEALKRVKGAYCFLLMDENSIITARDPYGFKPLCLGRIKDAFVISSESCALDLIEAEFLREIEPGEVVVINENGLKSIKPFPKPSHLAQCIFEHIYFSRPDSVIFGENVHVVRERLGKKLVEEYPVNADIVVPVPDSGSSAAVGFSKASGIPIDLGIIRNHYVGRTFIQPSQIIRDFNVRIKFNLIRDVLKNKRVVIVDDSIVRGTTSQKRVRQLRNAGVKEVHMRISCPPHKFPCFYGIDFPTKEELIANRFSSLNEIRKFLDVDSLGYLSREGMLSCVKAFSPEDYCTACFDGNYPVPFG